MIDLDALETAVIMGRNLELDEFEALVHAVRVALDYGAIDSADAGSWYARLDEALAPFREDA